MDFNSLPLDTKLQLILNDLSSCHVQGVDALKYGSALQALQGTIEGIRNTPQE